MQDVTAAFTAEEDDAVRRIAHNLQVSWKRDSLLNNRTFTIGVSSIGGNDVIGANPGAIGSPGNYRYFDESDYVTGLAWERGLNMPVGGVTKALAEAHLDNTSGRFTPRYMGGSSELYTAILPSRPMIINAGFEINGVDEVVPQFSGVLEKQPRVNKRSAEVTLQAADYVDFFENKALDQSAVFTGQSTDVIMEYLLQSQLGMSTSQYEIDPGINVIPFAFFDTGDKMTDIFQELTQAEYGHFFQDEEGVFKFKNRQWGDSSPYNEVQKVLLTSQVISAEAPADDHIINVTEVRGEAYAKQPLRVLMNFATATVIPANSAITLFFDYGTPVLEIIEPTVGGTDSYYSANTVSDDSGADVTSSVDIKSIDTFSTNSKIVFENTSGSSVFLNHVVISGRSAQKTGEIYSRLQDDSSVTAFNERVHTIENRFIQNSDWASSLAQLILDDFSEPENLQKIEIRAIPELQLFDLISWQGRYWRIFNIRATLDPQQGFTQELTLLQRTTTTYFRIGISTIGSSDKIAP